MPTVDIDKIVVGSYFRNNVVTKIDEEVKDLKNGKVKIRRLFTLDDGMVVIEDALYDFEEIVGEYKELQYTEIPFPDMSPGKKKKTKKKPKDRNESPPSPFPSSPIRDNGDDYEEEKRRKEEEIARQQAEEHARIEAEEVARREAEENMRREEEERSRLKAEERARIEEEERRCREAEAERRRIEAEEEARIQQIRQDWQPKKIWAFTSYNEDKGETIRAIWNLSVTSEKEHNTKTWPAKAIILYPPNQTLPDNAKSTPHGYWCYSRQDIQPNERDIEWIPRAEDGEAPFLVFLPGDTYPQGDDIVCGEWYMVSPTVWPPPLGPKPYCVHPPQTKPPVSLDGDRDVGIWWVGSNFPVMDPDAWSLSEVLVYEDGHRPDSEDSRKPQGSWGVAAGALPHEDGTYNPDDTWFILPGDELPDDNEWIYRGTWVLNTKENDTWPPYQEPPTLTTVYHEDNVEITDGPSCQNRAIWVQNAADIKASEWLPQKVLAYKKGQEPGNLDRSKPHGLWGRDPDSQPDENGNYFPLDVWYVFPGEDTPKDDEWVCEGTWIVDPNEEWVPYEKSPCKPERFNVCHPSQLNGHFIDSGNAIWKIGEGSPDVDVDSWESAPVLAYEFGNEPENLVEKPHGLWGRAIDAEPDENGNYDPNDTWFIYPGDTPPEQEEWNCGGVWMLDDSDETCPAWPPHKKVLACRAGPILATIYPEKKAYKETIEDGKTKGMWKYTAGKKVMDAGKQPKDVYLHDDGQGIESKATKNGGVWGFAPQVEPDLTGNIAPCDLWCFAPGETPPPDDEWQLQGFWVPIDPPEVTTEHKLMLASTDSTDSSRLLASTRVTPESKKTRVRRFDHSAWVFPSKEHAPPGQKDNLQGVWSTPPGDQPGGKLGIKYKDGEPMEVMVHQRGKEPGESDLKKIAHGKWGYVKDAQPNSRGIMDPKHMIFFPPGVECDADVTEQGIWTCPGAVIREITSWKFDNDNNIIHFKCTEIHFMNTVTTFTCQYVKKQ
jgi:hypothetical protein